MDYQSVFKNSGRLIWRHKILLVFGLLFFAARLPGILMSHAYSRFWLGSFVNISSGPTSRDSLEPVFDFFADPNLPLIFGGMIGIFVVFILIWVIATIAEAALIRGVADFDDGNNRSLGDLFSAGTKLLARFIAIDTVVFLPLFLILLVQMLTLGGGMIAGIVQLSKPGSDPNDLMPFILVIVIVLGVLTLLAIPVTILTAAVRLVAFRSAVLEDMATRSSIRRAWELVRTKAGEIIVTALLLYAVSYAVSMVASILVLPFSFGGMMMFMGPVLRNGPFSLGNIEAFITLITIASVVGVLPQLVYRIFSSAVWTLTYREWQRKS